MASDMFKQMQGQKFSPQSFMSQLNKLKAKGGDPNQIIQQMLNSGKITQVQYNMAVQRAQQIMQMLPTSVRR